MACQAILITRNDTIIFGRLHLLNYDDKIMLRRDFKKNKSAISSYTKQHRQLYKLKVTSREFRKDLSKQIIFGFGCSHSGNYYPPEAKKMMKYVLTKNQVRLSKWAKRINPELQAYGASGLLRLENSGNKLSDQELKIINHLKERNTKIHSCSGCIYGLHFDFKKVITWGIN